MEHSTQKPNFRVEPLEDSTFHPRIVSDLNTLTRYMVGLYKGANKDLKEFCLKYQLTVREAIKTNNIPALNIVWKAVYFHDRDNPDYETDIETACEYSNIQMLQHVVYGFYNYATLNGIDKDPNYIYFSQINKHPHVSEYLLGLNETLSKLDKLLEQKTDEERDEFCDSTSTGKIVSDYTAKFNKTYNIV